MIPVTDDFIAFVHSYSNFRFSFPEERSFIPQRYGNTLDASRTIIPPFALRSFLSGREAVTKQNKIAVVARWPAGLRSGCGNEA